MKSASQQLGGAGFLLMRELLQSWRIHYKAKISFSLTLFAFIIMEIGKYMSGQEWQREMAVWPSAVPVARARRAVVRPEQAALRRVILHRTRHEAAVVVACGRRRPSPQGRPTARARQAVGLSHAEAMQDTHRFTTSIAHGDPRVRSHCRFGNRGTDSLR